MRALGYLLENIKWGTRQPGLYRAYSRIIAASWITIFLIGCGCGEDECTSISDCPSGKVCQRGLCVAPKDGIRTDVGIDGDVDGDSDGDGDADTDGDTDADTDLGSDAPDSGDSDTASACVAVQHSGESCVSDCECISGACDKNICCTSGHCCNVKTDCADDRCRQSACDGNNNCVYGVGGFVCGEEDTDGEQTCMDGRVCDGAGNCAAVDPSACGFYAVSSYRCESDGSVVPVCRDRCAAANADEACVPGAVCQNETCVSEKALDNGASCTLDGECQTAHCENGFCCPEGECCNEVSDCGDSLCQSRSCTGDHRCSYSFNGFGCGQLDEMDGDTCIGSNRCDGQGKCLPVSPCRGAYGWNEGAASPYTCTDAAAIETCYSSCANISHCTDGYVCIGTTCVFKGIGNGDECTADDQCESGHCSNGHCCKTGTCCGGDEDCTDSLCNAGSYCGVDHACRPEAPIPCGESDTDGPETCDSDRRCDGRGNCLPLKRCDDAYAWNGATFTCSEDTVSEVCWTACYGAVEDVHCNWGYTCDGSHCVRYLFPNGHTCQQSGDCESGHCENGICCSSGECCLDVSDCDATRCVLGYCTGNFSCDYHPIGPCGSEDNLDEPGDGSGLCNGESRCDGEGSCEPLVSCDGAYAATGEYTCTTAGIAEECRALCTDDDDCNAGYRCEEGGICTEQLENGASGCEQNADCMSNNCTSLTGVCCESGWCCDDDDDCGGEPCNLDTWSCVFSCDNNGDDDARCEGLGDFHCDNGACNEDLRNGEGPCDEDSDCLSSYCDVTSGFCCVAGNCCGSDQDCNGNVCSDEGQCGTGCSEEAMCAAGYHCDDNRCVEDIRNGQGGCDEDADCASGNCTIRTGVCCSEGDGDCCNADDQCDNEDDDQRDRCTLNVCSVLSHCYAVAKGEGEWCDDGLFCNGTNRCNAVGRCVPLNDSPCQNDDSNFRCATISCDEDADRCVTTVNTERIGLPCTDEEAPRFCLGGRTMVCTANGLCVDPDPSGPTGCDEEPPSPCVYYQCNEGTNSCSLVSRTNGVSCDDGDACTGENQCYDGACVPAPTLPCADDDPCTTDPCTDEDGVAVCGDHQAIADGEPCNDHYACFGETPVCQNGLCVQSEDMCRDGAGICTIQACAEHYYDWVTCGDRIDNVPLALNCGETRSITDPGIFATREYDTYGERCPGTFDGMEAPIEISLPMNSNITVSVSNTSPPSDLAIMYPGDWCAADTCEAYGLNSITISGTAGTHQLILEAMDVFPPDSFDISVACF